MMYPLGIALILSMRWHRASPPIESEAWWFEHARREGRARGRVGDGRTRGQPST
jgi:hypothetical protein